MNFKDTQKNIAQQTNYKHILLDANAKNKTLSFIHGYDKYTVYLIFR